MKLQIVLDDFIMSDRWFSEQTVKRLLTANNVLFTVTLLLYKLCPWLVLAALFFWAFTLAVLIQGGLVERKCSIATVGYTILFVLVGGYALWVLVYFISN